MKLNDYQNKSKRTLDPNKDKYEMMKESCIGLAEEVGETIGIFKKGLFHGHEVNINDIIKELGDTLWYLTAICTLNNITLEEVAKANIEKLEKRYPQGFTQEASINREENCLHEWQYKVEVNLDTNGEEEDYHFGKKCRKCGKKL